jgi:hypothetical protein
MESKQHTTYHNITVPTNRSNTQKLSKYNEVLSSAIIHNHDEKLNQILSKYDRKLENVCNGDIINLKKNRSVLDSFIVWNNEMVPLPQTIAGNKYKLMIPECVTPTKFPIDYWYEGKTSTVEFVPISLDFVKSHIHKYLDKETHLKDCGMVSEEDTASIDLEQEYDSIYNLEFKDYQFELVDDFNFNDELFFIDFNDNELISYPVDFKNKIYDDINKIKAKYSVCK